MRRVDFKIIVLAMTVLNGCGKEEDDTEEPIVDILLEGTTATNETTCSGLSITTRKAGPAAAAVTQNTTFTLTSSNGGIFFTDSNCTTSATEVELASGSHTVDFYYRGAKKRRRFVDCR